MCLSDPWLEGFQELQPVRSRRDGNLDASPILGGSPEGILTRVVSARWEFVPGRIRELERFAVSTGEGIREWIDSKITGEDESSNDVWRCDDGMGWRRSIQ